MASRPVFIPGPSPDHLVQVMEPEFEWSAGFAASQKQKCIKSLHEAAKTDFSIEAILEISSKSLDAIGVSLSAFNLPFQLDDGRHVPLECVFQASKVFAHKTGPFLELLDFDPLHAKRFHRTAGNVELTSFEFEGVHWPLQPKTLFYDWLYLRALSQLPVEVRDEICEYGGFTDIEFNPKKSINCQARSAALYVALERLHLFNDALVSLERYKAIVDPTGRSYQQQLL